jgi:hypothetical protein
MEGDSGLSPVLLSWPVSTELDRGGDSLSESMIDL